MGRRTCGLPFSLLLLSTHRGTVVLQAVIGKDGTVQDVHALSGHPMLTQAAVDAVRKWRYKPYYLNGAPVEADTQINLNFTLSGE